MDFAQNVQPFVRDIYDADIRLYEQELSEVQKKMLNQCRICTRSCIQYFDHYTTFLNVVVSYCEASEKQITIKNSKPISKDWSFSTVFLISKVSN